MDNQQKAKEILAKYKIQGYVPASKQAVDINSRFAELDAAASGQSTQTGQQDGLLKSIAKDVAGTLVVNPITRATEAVTRLVAPNSLAAQGYEQLQAEGKGQDVLGVNVPSVKALGEGGGKQIVGEALKTASYLFPYGKVAQGVGGLALGASKLTPTAIAASKIAGNVASGATGGYLADVGMGLTDSNQSVGEALTPGAGTVLGAAIPLAGPALRATGRATSKIGSKIGELGIPTTSREAQILQTYKANNPFFKRVGDVLAGTEKAPQTAAKTAVEKGLIGTKSGIGVQSKRAAGTLWNDVISPRLKASDQAVDLDGFFSKIENDIVTSTPEISRQKALLNALNSFKDDYAGINSVSLEKLQKLKEGWAEFIPEKAYKGENIAGAANQVRKLMANESRQTIYSQLGDDVKQAYFDYGNLQGLQKLGQVSMTGAKLKGGAGSFISEIASQAVTPITTVGGQAVYRLGNGIEFIGNLGAKNLGEALGIQGGLKFPGDMAVDDISKSIKKTQEKSLPIKTQTSQTIKTTPKIDKNVISDTIPKQSLKGKGTIPENSGRKIEPDLTLTGEDAQIQNASIAKYKANPQKLTQDYLENYAGNDKKVVNTDEARKLFKDVGYKGANSPAVQEASSAVAKDAWEYLLKTSKSNDSLIYAGGSGTGKTSAVKNILSGDVADAGAILDGNLSTMKSAEARIGESIKAGKYPTVVYVYRDPVDAWINGVIKRMNNVANGEGGRVVPLSVFLENHAGSYNVVKSLLNDASNGVRYDVKMVDNSLGKGNQKLLERSKFDTIKYQSNLKQELLNQTKKLYDKGTIKKDQYEALIK